MFGCVRSLLLNQIGSLCLTVVLGLALASAAEVQLTCTFQNAIPPVTDAAAKEWHDSGLHLGIVSTASAEFRL
jgi:hypothetical protein